MEILLLVTGGGAGEPLPALALLPHVVRRAPVDLNSLVTGPPADVAVVDARTDLAEARAICRMLYRTGLGMPVLAVVVEAGLVAVSLDWGVTDVILDRAGPAEVEARLRLAVARAPGRPAGAASDPTAGQIRSGDLVIDTATYSARLKGRLLELTYKEFELLRFLAQHPDRVFTRDDLLREVWGQDYYGGTRTVDVHIRRLRAKLGFGYESMIGTVRQVGYKFVPPAAGQRSQPAAPEPTPLP